MERGLAALRRGEPLVSVHGSGASGVGESGAAALAEALAQHARLLSLRLRGHAVGDAGASRLAEGLERHGALRALDLSENAIGDVGAAQLAKALLHGRDLRLLSLQGNKIGDAGILQLAQVLGKHPELEELELGGNALGESAASCLAKSLAKHAGLQVLRLEQNAVGDVGASALADALGPGSTLRALHLGTNGISDTGALRLSLALGRHAGLRELHLSDNAVGDKGALGLARALEAHPGMRALVLERNRIGDSAVLELVGVLVRMEREDITCNVAGNPVRRFDATTLANLSIAARTVRILSRRGMKLKHMLMLWKDGTGSGNIDKDIATTLDAVAILVRPEMAKYDASYAEFHHAPRAEAYVIHPWTGLLRDLLLAIAAHATGSPIPSLDPDHVSYLQHPEALERSYYVDVFTMDQNLPVATGNPRCQTDKFDLVMPELQRCGAKALLVVDPKFTLLSRLWCLAEAHCAIQIGMPLEVSFSAICPFPRGRRGTRMRDAEVLRTEDHAWLLNEIEARGVGCEAFDAAVTSLLEAKICARYAEVHPTLPQRMRDELDWLQAQDNAREDLLAAISGDDAELLARCIKCAEEVCIEHALIMRGMQRRATLVMSAAMAEASEGLGWAARVTARMLEGARRRLPEREYEARKQAAAEALAAAMEGADKRAVLWTGPPAATVAAVEALQQALIEAVEADVEEDAIAKARRKLMELEVVTACKGEDTDAMHQAIVTARDSGVDGDIVQAAGQRLLRRKVDSALESNNSEALLRAIIFAKTTRANARDVEAAGVKLVELDPKAWQLLVLADFFPKLLGFLGVGEAAASAGVCTWLAPSRAAGAEGADPLQRATEALQQAIEVAVEAEVAEDTVQAVRGQLAEVELQGRRMAARVALLPASAAEDLALLRSCVAAAEEAGVEAVPLAVARRKLAQLELRAATEASDSQELQRCIEDAKRTGVREEALAAAKQRLAQLDLGAYRHVLSTDMAAASEAGDRELLRQAISLAVEAAVHAEAVNPARKKLAELDVAWAVECGSAQQLQTAISTAVDLGVEAQDLERARRKLAELEMVAASKRSDAELLATAIEVANEAGVESELIRLARRKLAELELSRAMQRRDVVTLEKAVNMAADLGVDEQTLLAARKKLAGLKLALATEDNKIQALRQAIDIAVEIGVRENAVAASRKKLALLELQVASSGESIKVLKQAMAEAAEQAIGGEPMDLARRQLALLEMQEAARSTDAEALLQAIETAKKAHVDRQDVEAAKKKLAKLDPEVHKECLVMELAAATAGTDLEALQLAIEAAVQVAPGAEELLPARGRLGELLASVAPEMEDAGLLRRALELAGDVAPEVLEVPRARLHELEHEARRAAAEERLRQAMEGDDLGELRAALAEAKCVAADRELLEAAQKYFT